MKFLISFLLLNFISFAVYSEQGTMSTDNTTASEAEASMSGVRQEEEIDTREEEVKIEDDEYEVSPEREDALEIDQEKMDAYESERY
jgi:hypothetical protein